VKRKPSEKRLAETLAALLEANLLSAIRARLERKGKGR
jgi:hypothetical protein